ncbi:MAG: hypothetical protein EZS28_041567 [Streblomastix strix]|uniref:Uncharacterized protein n=1 Tax=Streblomastix strix TaxID=222440 RepID=A0A5J4TWQ4_9EUKA|nr:MAG: hypothetical protein EZS28_041567 [Streblomastix strix]
MQQEQEFYETAKAIISFTDSYTQNKQGKRNEQSDSESTDSLIEIAAYLKYFIDKIGYNNAYKQVIQFPKLLQSLSALSRFKFGTHLKEEEKQLRLKVRSCSRGCLYYIQVFGDEQDQSELVNNGYGRVISISYCTAGGMEEEHDVEIKYGLYYISRFLRELLEGIYFRQPSFQPLPLLVPVPLEQIEEEGANEEIDAQMSNNRYNGVIMIYADRARAVTLNHFIHRR